MPFIDLSRLPDRRPQPGIAGRFVHSDRMTTAYWRIAAGSVFPEHSHPHEQVVNVVEGELELTVAGETRVIRPGTVAVIPSSVPHSARGLTDCRVIDVFQPVRDDYR